MSSIKKDSLFLPASFFMLRAPALPIENFFQLSEKKDLEECFFSNEDIKEAILIASPQLYRALLKEKNFKQKKQIKSSLLKYISRMSTRSTPFGLFSFVALGFWDKSTNGFFEFNKLKKRVRVDMQWLYLVIDMLCKEPKNFAILPIRANPFLVICKNRVYLKKDNEKQLSIRVNALTSTILEFTKKTISIADLEKKIIQKFPTIDLFKTRNVIKKLLDQQILESALIPSLLTEDPYNDFLKKVFHYKLHHSKLALLLEIQKKIKQYNRSFSKNKENEIKNINALMEKVVSVDYYLQVDLSSPYENITLPKKVCQEISEVIELVWNISAGISETDILNEYLSKFLEKYGSSRRVALLELLDEQRGLGIPKVYQKDRLSEEKNENEIRWISWLKNQLTLCLIEDKKEIIITKDIIDNLIIKKPDKNKAFLSFDLFCNVIAKSAFDLDRGEYILYLFSNTQQAGNTFGRFLDILNVNVKKHLKDLYRKEEQLDKNYCFVETSYFPIHPRHANLTIHANLRKYCMDLTKNNFISLQDIYVAANEQGFYFTNKRGDKKFLFVANNVLAQQLTPISVRFLKDVTYHRYKMLNFSFWKDLIDSPFLPRIKYKKAIISPAQWYVNLTMLEIDKKDSLQKIQKRFINWIDKMKVYRYIFLNQGDNCILLDIKQKDHIEQMVSQLKKDTFIRLIEKIDYDSSKNWLRSSKGSHLTELIIPFVKNTEFHSTNNFDIPKFSDFDDSIRWKFVGSDWLFVKFYVSKQEEQRFLLTYLYPFANDLLKKDIIKQWFFIRYVDQKHHLRVRFQAKKEKIINKLIPLLHSWSCFLFKEKIINDLQFGTYERELERYGGEKLIDAIEAFFCSDTYTTVDLLNILSQKQTKLPIYVIAAISIMDLYKKFDSIISKTNSTFVLNKQALQGIRDWRTTLIKHFKFIFTDSKQYDTNEDRLIHQALLKRAENLNDLKIKCLIEKNNLTISTFSILNSLIHMHCNRLIGINPIVEQKANAYANYILSKSKFFMSKMIF